MLGKNTREFRRKHGLTQQKLAEKTGLCYAIICKIEQGVSKEPSITTIVKIADALNLGIDTLIGRRVLKK